MKKRPLAMAVVILGILAFWYESRRTEEGGKRTSSGQRADSSTSTTEDEAGDAGQLRTKASIRHEVSKTATHRPEKLQEFYLPEVDIAGLGLEAALRKLQAAYEEACRMTGEVPLRLSFSVPPGKDSLLHLKLGVRTLDSSIRLLAGASGLMVTREGSDYLFETPEKTGEGEALKQVLRVPPDLISRLGSMSGKNPATSPDLLAAYASLGMDLDPATRLKFSGASSTLMIETTNAADVAAVTAMTNLITKETPVQHQFKTTVFKLSADMEWTPPDLSQLDDAQVQALMRTLAQTKGVDLMTLPATTTRSGEQAKVEIIKELIAPVAGTSDEFETHNVGVVFKATPSLLGFGHQVAMDFTITTGDIDPKSSAAVIHEDAAIADTSYTRDGAARLHIQTHPDGTRTAMLVTPTLIDATGRPVRGEE